MAPDAIITLHTGGHKWVGGDNMNMDGEAVIVVIIVIWKFKIEQRSALNNGPSCA